MRKLLRALAAVLLAGVAVAAAMAVFARFQDGPVAAFPGGPLASGAWAEPSWSDASFLTNVQEIELQLLEPPRSRTTWMVVHEGVAYIPCGLPSFRLWKQWPHQAARDGRAVVRVEGARHARELVRVSDPSLLSALRELTFRKYGGPRTGDDPELVWFFRLDPRRGGSAS